MVKASDGTAAPWVVGDSVVSIRPPTMKASPSTRVPWLGIV
jgi:hypothetical protein